MLVSLARAFVISFLLLLCLSGTSFLPLGSVQAAIQDDEVESADEEDNEKKVATVTVRGQLVLADPSSDFEIKGMPVILDEFMTPPALPLPDKFSEMAMEDRQKWYASFIESEAGKAYQQKVEEMQDLRHYEEGEADAEGRFVFQKVKRSRYGLYGQKQFTKDGKTFIAEFQAEFPIEDKVKFIELDRLPLVIKRVLQVGESAPDLQLKAEGTDNQSIHALNQYKGKHVLLYFWTMSSAKHIQAEIQKAVDSDLDLEILGINLNPPGEEREKYLAENETDWKNLVSDGLEKSPVTVDYAVTQLPSMWLVGPEGKIKVTDIQFFQALAAPDVSLAETLKKALAGQSIIEEEPEE